MATAALLAAPPACGRGGEARLSEADARLSLRAAEAALQRARETSDPAAYSEAERALRAAEPALGGDIAFLLSKGSLLLSLHRFSEAAAIGDRAVAVAPTLGAAHAIVVDAANELGRYDTALAATQRMVDLRPGPASFTRVATARALRGDLDGAVQVQRQAAEGGESGENAAYMNVQLGHLLVTTGDQDGAEQAYRTAERAFPSYSQATAGLARVRVAQGRYADAADILALVVDRSPSPEHAVAWSEAATAAGRPADAKKAEEIISALLRLAKTNGVDIDLELALIEADRRPGPEAVDRARRAAVARPSIAAFDTLAWNLSRAGQHDAAAIEIDKALRLGTKDPLIRFHAAEIAYARSDKVAAANHLRSVLSTNPRFSARFAARVVELAAALDLPGPR